MWHTTRCVWLCYQIFHGNHTACPILDHTFYRCHIVKDAIYCKFCECRQHIILTRAELIQRLCILFNIIDICVFCSKFNFDSIFKQILAKDFSEAKYIGFCVTDLFRFRHVLFLWWQPMKWKLECFSVFSPKSDRILWAKYKIRRLKNQKIAPFNWQQRKVSRK